MSTLDQCLAELEALALSADPNALLQAETSIEDLLDESSAPPAEAARLLGELQSQFMSRTPPSPLRADMLDALGSHILRLLEAGEAG